MGRPPKARTTKKAADAPALVVPSLAKPSQVTAAALVVPSLAAEAQAEPAESKEDPSQAKAALKSRVLTKSQALARERTLQRATAVATETLRARAKQARRPTRGSVSTYHLWQKKPDAKAMPPSYRPPRAPSLKPQPPPMPGPPDQKEALWHVDGDHKNSDCDHDVLRHAASQAGWCHYFLT